MEKMVLIRKIGMTGTMLAGIVCGCSNLPARSGSGEQGPITGLNQTVEIGEQADPTPAELDVRRANLLLAKAKLARADGDTAAAIQHLESILEIDPGHAEAAHQLAVLNFESKDLKSAERLFQMALKQEEKNARLNCDYGYFCYLTGRWDQAKEHLTRAIQIDPSLAQAQTNLAMLEARRGETASARQRFESVGCSEAEVQNNIALASLLENEVASAEATYKVAYELDPQIPQIQRGRSLAAHISKTVGNKGEVTVKLSDLPRDPKAPKP